MKKKSSFKPERHQKGWGHEDWIINTEKYCGKLLYFNKGKRFSVHYHKLKDETFYLESGKLQVFLADSPEDYDAGNITEHTMNPGDIFHIWPGRVHQVIALEDTKLFEFSTQHFDEDSYRIIKGD
jgi:quercetin dioxygenase-like cupin family protein